MKTPEEIKKGLEHCTTDGADCTGCMYRDECMEEYDNAPIQRDALIRQLEEREWELFNLLSSAWFAKTCYFKQEDGKVYSRVSGEYMTFDQAIDEFASELTNETQLEAQIPKWISVEERVPKNLDNVLICDDRGGIVVGHYDEDDGRFWKRVNDNTFHSADATHWMPLPEPPKER